MLKSLEEVLPVVVVSSRPLSFVFRSGVDPEAGDEVPGFGLGFPFDGTGLWRCLLQLGGEALRFHKRHALEAGPPTLVNPAFSGDVDCPAATRLHPSVVRVHVGVAGLESKVEAALEKTLHVDPQPFLVVLEPKHVVGSGVYNRFCSIRLAAHRVDCYDASLQGEYLKQLRNRVDLVGSVFLSALPEHQLLIAGPCLHQMERAFSGGPVSAFP
jgi:hypothetical protein